MESASKRKMLLALLPLYAWGLSAPGASITAPKKVVVVGAGWGGLGAAKALARSGVEVVVLDAGQPLEAMVTESGKPFDAGQRGFWKDYPNLNALGDELGLDPYTDFTESSFFGPEGLEATAPVFSGSMELPSPLGQVFASFDRFKRLPLADRASIAGLLYAMVDLNRTPETFAAYDRMSAHELFRTAWNDGRSRLSQSRLEFTNNRSRRPLGSGPWASASASSRTS